MTDERAWLACATLEATQSLFELPSQSKIPYMPTIARWAPSYTGPANGNGKKNEADCPVPIPSHYVPNGTLAEHFREGHKWYENEIRAKIAHSLQTPRTARTVQTHKIVSLQTCIGPPTCRYWKVEWEAVPNEQPPSGENVEALLEAESWVHEIAIKGTIAQ